MERQTIYVEFYKFDHQSDLKKVLDDDKMAQRTIERLNKAIDDMNEYRRQLADHAAYIVTLEPKIQVSIVRHKRESVTYYVKAQKIFEGLQAQEIESLTYEGRNRSDALKAFEAMKKRYNGCEAVKQIEKGRWEK
jgi:hypothetical protein